MAQLKDGRSLLAIALSSDAGDADDGDDEGATEAKTHENSRGAHASSVTSEKNITINLWVNRPSLQRGGSIFFSARRSTRETQSITRAKT